MSKMNNRVSPDPPADTISISKTVGGQFACVSCNVYFWVYAGPLGQQTLFCHECMKALQNSIIREKQQNYGW